MNFNYHIHNSYVKCPYCDKNCDDSEGMVAAQGETRIEIECEHCEKKFFADSSIVYNTYSDCELNGEKHDLRPSGSHPTVFHCKNCYYHEVKG